MNQLKILSHTHKSVTKDAAQELIKRALCTRGGSDCFCATCFSVVQKTHPSIIWLSGKTTYTKDDLTPLHALTQLARSSTEQLFFVLENPEFLLPASANSLLKTLEEPPANTTFLFLSQNTSTILPTILSRAELVVLQASSTEQILEQHPLFSLALAACKKEEYKITHLESVLQKDCPDAQASALLIDELIQALSQETSYSNQITILFQLRSTPPAPGSSKLFWRTLFMRMGLS